MVIVQSIFVHLTILCCLVPRLQVKKAEGAQQTRWWTHKPPTNMTLQQLQRMAASKLGEAAAAGVSGGVSRAQARPSADAVSGAKPKSCPGVQASDGPTQLGNKPASGNSSKPSQAAAVNTATLEVIQK